jgi:hypothetical protein
MRLNRVVWGLVVLAVVAVSVVSACGGAAPEPAELAEQAGSIDAEALLQDRCTGCHGLDRATSGSRPSDEWEEIVVRMVGYGAELSEEEQAVLVDHLAQTYGP